MVRARQRVNDEIRRGRVYGLYRAMDCYVIPSRGEGWCMRTIWSAAMAKGEGGGRRGV